MFKLFNTISTFCHFQELYKEKKAGHTNLEWKWEYTQSTSAIQESAEHREGIADEDDENNNEQGKL